VENSVLQLFNISKKLKGKDIVKDINLTVNTGEVFGFLGPNGAGKTTTIRMIVGLIKPTTGNIIVCGHSLNKEFNTAMSNVGCIIEGPDMYKYLTGMENLKQFAAMDRRITLERIEEVVEIVGLKHRIHDKVGIYSLGMRQRLGIAQAILHRPKLLILDEPTNGLDPSGIAEFRQLIRKLAYEEGMGVFVSSHILSEIEQMCDSVAIVRAGTVVKSIKVSEIIKENLVEWQVSDTLMAINILKTKWNIEGEQIKKDILKAPIGEVLVKEINRAFFTEGVDIEYCYAHKNSLEDLFLDITEGDEIV
jgi:ABC-2 type transport system ATP-binding protein